MNTPSTAQAGAKPGPRSASSPGVGATSSGDGIQSKTFTTAGGATITVGGGSGSGTTAGGTQIGGGVAGIKIETAGGDTFVKGSGIAGASNSQGSAFAGGSRAGFETSSGEAGYRGTSTRAATDAAGNSAMRTGSVTAGRDAAGNAAVNVSGGYGNSSGYRQAGSVTAAKNQYGYSSVSARGGYGYAGTGTGQFGATGAVMGPGGNVVSAGRGGSFVNGQFVGGQSWAAVNGAYTRWNAFGPAWYSQYPGAWWPGKWALATTAWATAAWGTAGAYCGCSGEGTYYDYGENVTYEDETVYNGDQAVASADQYYEQARQLARSKLESKNDEWLPLGVFAIIAEPGQTNADRVLQLALNKDGALRGNLEDSLTGTVTPVYGAVDQATQRTAIMLEGNDTLAAETGLYNLTNDEVPALVHQAPDSRAERTLIRLKPPEEQEQPVAN